MGVEQQLRMKNKLRAGEIDQHHRGRWPSVWTPTYAFDRIAAGLSLDFVFFPSDHSFTLDILADLFQPVDHETQDGLHNFDLSQPLLERLLVHGGREGDGEVGLEKVIECRRCRQTGRPNGVRGDVILCDMG